MSVSIIKSQQRAIFNKSSSFELYNTNTHSPSWLRSISKFIARC